ncbi:MAG: electron transport complex subunit E [Oscillospiraceae bacterium]|jgi:electron transport complex protein RnfE|nr:electron transport complex subunit E [Oscillospiraceae bacterium]MCM0706092.1 electron transport complex subunit E [Faecalicatena sp. BF-R-105]MDY3219735.1 electron transport complex subunit E [Candidatus Fimivivens sp.]SFI75968.1 electron transport complex protein RnfE [Ruminococcaceae bacterium D5]GKH51276.1 electron transport complex subunit E [Eubacteriales bacterium]
MSKLSTITNGFIKENPVFVLVLGTCPTLATSTSAVNSIGMGLAATFVLICSNFVISCLRKSIPDKVRIPCYIVVIAGFVSVVQLVVKAYAPDLDKALGIYLPLIVVNCIILGRAEMFAAKNGPLDSALDGLGMGIGFTIALLMMSFFREIPGAGSFFGFELIPENFRISIMTMAPGGFFVFGCMIALVNKITKGKAIKKKEFGCKPLGEEDAEAAKGGC